MIFLECSRVLPDTHPGQILSGKLNLENLLIAELESPFVETKRAKEKKGDIKYVEKGAEEPRVILWEGAARGSKI